MIKEYPKLWELYPEIWSTKAKFFSFLRGNLRRALWEKYPVKIQFKNRACSPPPEGYTGRAKSGLVCPISGEWTGKSMLEVDHIKGEASLRDWEDLEPFILHLLTTHDNMQLLSKESHKIKSYAERVGISLEEAILEKKVIQFKKLKSTEQIKLLTDLVLSDTITIPKNSTGRVELYRNMLKEK